MRRKKLKILTLCSDSLIVEAFKSIIQASGYKHYAVNDYINLENKIEKYNIDLILVDETILVNGKKENYYNFFKDYKNNVPVLLAVREDNKKFLKKDIFTYILKPINIMELKTLVEPYRKYSEDITLNNIKLGQHTYNSHLRTLELKEWM